MEEEKLRAIESRVQSVRYGYDKADNQVYYRDCNALLSWARSLVAENERLEGACARLEHELSQEGTQGNSLLEANGWLRSRVAELEDKLLAGSGNFVTLVPRHQASGEGGKS